VSKRGQHPAPRADIHGVRSTLARLLHPALPAVVVAGLALAVPVVTATDAHTVGTAGSVVAKAAQAEGTPGGDQRYPVGGAAMEQARAIALAHWGANPCGGAYTLSWTPLDIGTNATASWRNPTDAWNNSGANFDCRIDINPQADFDFPKLCTVLTHEMGHLVGRQHDANPGQLMSAYYSTPLPACQGAEPAGTATSTVPAVDDADGVDIVATDEPRRVLRKTTTKAKYRTKFVKRCVLRKASSGKRVKRCRTAKVKVLTKKPVKRVLAKRTS
jgi:hypothetical protein